MRFRGAVVMLLASSTILGCAAPATLKTSSDGFPAGQETPEGVAGDLARVFIRHDVNLFRRICIRPYGEADVRSKYAKFLAGTAETLIREASSRQRSLNNPQKISKIFAARHLTKNGPRSYGRAAFGFNDVMFVDVEVLLNDGISFVKRTLVIQDRDGKWYAHPLPHLSPLLSAGLEQESVSSQMLSVASKTQR